ncbi:MAG: hypothetical protein V9E96_05845 [Chitinophagaceae bacterium]
MYQYGVEGSSRLASTPKSTFSFTGGLVQSHFLIASVGIEFLVSYMSVINLMGYNGSNGIIQLGLGLQVHLDKDK